MKNSDAFNQIADFIGDHDGWTKRVPRRVLLAMIRNVEAAAEQRGEERKETAIEQLARDLLARLSHDYGDAEDVDDEIKMLFARGERLLPVERTEPLFTCPGCGRDTPVIFNHATCPDCAEQP